jgi:hypothetical protein
VTTHTPITLEQANQQVLDSERMLARLFVHFNPEEVAAEAARRFRRVRTADSMRQNPPHCMIHAIESACAYFTPLDHRPMDSAMFDGLMSSLMGIDEPTMTALAARDGLMSLMAYMHRSQLDLQRELWTVPLGRAEMLFADPAALPKISDAFQQRFGLSPRQWVQMAFLAYAATGLSSSQLGFDEAYIGRLAESDVPVAAAHSFLNEVSRTPKQIGEAYRALRQLNAAEPAVAPWKWYQRPAFLTQHPIIRFPTGWGVPAPSLLFPLFNELLHARLAEVATGELREELSDRFTAYIQRVFEHQLPGCSIVTERSLRGQGKVADLAIDLPNAVLVIEAKSIVFERKALTEQALTSGPPTEIVDGAIQVAETAQRIVAGECASSGLPRDKPIVGAIATLGSLPHGNADALFDSGADEFAKRGLSGPALTPALLGRPIVLGNEALELLAVYLRSSPNGLPGLVAEKSKANIHAVGDWPLFLSRKVQGGKNHDLGLWRSAFHRMLTEFEVRQADTKRKG